ncbi:hypothetical protein PVAP13_2NG398203 [Panicum virgatum]|uniref:Uncharacterized protein n=1 Tax=Panicum virgatum TaxID=38727 RepID=A0A8T0VLA0_PANVG|nr:hypothetical protein PVAP13_2NG398203 [Panicum virgatum]
MAPRDGTVSAPRAGPAWQRAPPGAGRSPAVCGETEPRESPRARTRQRPVRSGLSTPLRWAFFNAAALFIFLARAPPFPRTFVLLRAWSIDAAPWGHRGSGRAPPPPHSRASAELRRGAPPPGARELNRRLGSLHVESSAAASERRRGYAWGASLPGMFAGSAGDGCELGAEVLGGGWCWRRSRARRGGAGGRFGGGIVRPASSDSSSLPLRAGPHCASSPRSPRRQRLTPLARGAMAAEEATEPGATARAIRPRPARSPSGSAARGRATATLASARRWRTSRHSVRLRATECAGSGGGAWRGTAPRGAMAATSCRARAPATADLAERARALELGGGGGRASRARAGALPRARPRARPARGVELGGATAGGAGGPGGPHGWWRLAPLLSILNGRGGPSTSCAVEQGSSSSRLPVAAGLARAAELHSAPPRGWPSSKGGGEAARGRPAAGSAPDHGGGTACRVCSTRGVACGWSSPEAWASGGG